MPTEEQEKAKNNLIDIAKRNAAATNQQLDAQIANYDLANKQNRALADKQLGDNQRKGSVNRFEAMRGLQNSAVGLLGSMGQALNGVGRDNVSTMLADRNDSDNNVHLAQQQQNADQIENSYMDAYNQNNIAKAEAIANAQKGLMDMEGDLAANLNNIDPSYYSTPGTGDADLGAGNLDGRIDKDVVAKNAALSGYAMPDYYLPKAINTNPNRIRNSASSYFNRQGR